jgi:hypothetical protein
VTGADGAVLDGTGLAPTWTTGVRIKSGNVIFNNIDVTNFKQDGIIIGYEASIPGSLKDVHVTNCRISNIQPGNHGFGIYAGYQAEDFKRPVPPKLTAHLDYSGLLIEGNEIINTDSSSVVLQSITGTPGTIVVRNNYIHDNENDGIWIDSARNIVIEDNVIANNMDGIYISSYGDAFQGVINGQWVYDWDNQQLNGPYGPMNIQITGNQITGNTTYGGIYLQAGYPATISINLNDISGNGIGVGNYLTESVDASGNWWGTIEPVAIAGAVIGPADYTPWLTEGDQDPDAPGFQPPALDTEVPAAPGVALTSDTGSSDTDGITQIGTLTLTGVETDATVEYSTDGGGTWTNSFTAAEGNNAVQVRQTDPAGNVSSATAFTFMLDTVAPTLTASISAPSASGWYDSLSGPAVVTYSAYDETSGVATPAPYTFSDGVDMSVDAITVTDVAGNTSLPAGAFSGINQDTGHLAAGIENRNGSLYIIGTGADDQIQIKLKGRDQLHVTIDPKGRAKITQSFNLAVVTGQIIAYGLAGDDHIEVQDKVMLPALLFGNDGDDHLTAGGGVTVLVGGDHDDHLQGGKAPCMLIGGNGEDHLQADKGGAILVAGTTDFDDNVATLIAILNEWADNGTANMLTLNTVHDDSAVDHLNGGSAADWFFANYRGDGVLDKLSGNHKQDSFLDV